jgi:hypothetical protein
LSSFGINRLLLLGTRGITACRTIRVKRPTKSKGASKLLDVKADKNPEDVKVRRAIRAVQAVVVNRATAKNKKEDGC